MDNNKKTIEEIVRHSLNNLATKAPQGAWEGIEARIAQPRSFRIAYLATAASVLFALLISLFFYSSEDSDFFLAEKTSTDSIQNPPLSQDQDSYQSDDSFELNENIGKPKKNETLRPNEKSTTISSNDYPQTNEKPSAIYSEKTKLEHSTINLANRADVEISRISSLSLHHSKLEKIKSEKLQLLPDGQDNYPRLINVKTKRNYLPSIASIDKNQKENSKQTGFIIGGAASPLYSFRNSNKNSENELFSLTGGEENLNNETPMLAYSGGISLAYETNRWNFSSGVYYAQQGQVMDKVNITKVTINNSAVITIAPTSMGNVQFSGGKSPVQLSDLNETNPTNHSVVPGNTQLVDAKLTQRYETIEIPFITSYRLNNHALSVSMLGGLSMAYRLSDKTELDYQNQTLILADIENLETTSYQSLIGLDLQYPLTKQLQFSLQPLFRYGLTPLNPAFVVNHIPYSFSIYTGFRVRF